MRKIKVSKFMALKEVEIEIKDLLLILGEQASGKSTLAKLIYFCRSLKEDFTEHIVDLVYDGSVSEKENIQPFWRKISTKFYNYFGSTRHLSPFEIIYQYDENKRLTLSQKDDRSLKITFEPNEFYQEFVSPGNVRNSLEQLGQVVNSQVSNTFKPRVLKQELDRLESFVNKLFCDSYIPLFIPAGRNTTVNYSSQFQRAFYAGLQSDLDRIRDLDKIRPSSDNQIQIKQSLDLYLMKQFLNYVDRLLEQFKEKSFEDLIIEHGEFSAPVNEATRETLQSVVTLFDQVLKGKYIHDRFGEKIYLSAEEYVYLNNASSGQQEAIRILQDAFMTLLEKESTFKVIEEPEAHLYPLAQKALMEVLAIVLNHTNSQLILTTHSPYILSVVNNLLFARCVATTNPVISSQVEEVISPFAWLDPKKVGVYFLKDGNCDNIFDEELGLINQNRLDEISEHLGSDFDRLYELHSQSF